MQNFVVTDFPDSPDIESSTSGYASRFSGKVGQWFLAVQDRATKKAIKAHFGDKKGLTVADVGGGHGQNVKLMANLGHHLTIVGSHSSETTQIQEAINKGQIEYVESSLLELPFADHSFDVVICYRVLSHMHSWERLCDELMRVSNTLVLVDYPNKRSVNVFTNLFFGWKKRVEENTRRYRLFSDSDVSQQFQKRRWQGTFIYRQYLFPMALHRLVGSRTLSLCFENVAKILGLTFLLGSPAIAGFVCPEMIELVLQTGTSSIHHKEVN
ncbi:MAG: class I SAM-dependent methyltransferase [Acidiferrobacterales bacterium]|nr:class I SAM-dependent methyltransferase [Acidiferrobacterales bacterium]